MHVLSGDQAEAAEKQHEEIQQELSEDSGRDIDANAESIVAERMRCIRHHFLLPRSPPQTFPRRNKAPTKRRNQTVHNRRQLKPVLDKPLDPMETL